MSRTLLPLKGVRVLSVALNLPGPAALMRCRAMGATCVKIEPPSGDPMARYRDGAYAELHQGVRVMAADLKSEPGQRKLQRELARTDVLLTSFRPTALAKLGMDWKALHKAHPQLNLVAIVGARGERAEEPGHDLTYMAEAGLVDGTQIPPTLFADMGGSLMAAEAVLQVCLERARTGKGVRIDVGLFEAAQYLALPRTWGLTTPKGSVGGAHAGYRVYPCKDGRAALAALEPHFAAALCRLAGVQNADFRTMFDPTTHEAVAAWCARHTRAQLDRAAVENDIPLLTLA